MVSPFLPDDEKLAAVREALPATGAGIYLNTGSLGPLPAETHRAMADLADWELRVGRSSYDYFLELLQRMDEARAGVAAVVVASPDSIALTHSTTDGMNIATWAVDWRAGDRAVTSRFEHAGGLGPLYTVRDRLGVDLVMADLGDGGDDEQTLRALDEAIVPGTKLVSLSHVAWTTGAVLPIARIVELAHARGALVAVDGAQAAGAIPVDVGALGADFYSIPAQKWLLGPEGMAALHVAPAVLDRAHRTFSGYFSYAGHDLVGNAVLHPDARRFEASGYHRPSVVGMARSLGWLSMYVGLDWVYRRGSALARLAAARLAEIPGVELLTPRHQMANLVAFRIAGWGVDLAFEEISKRTFAIFRTLPALQALRISVGFFNTDAEIERFAQAVELLASHTPESLPPRRTLAMLDEGGS
jgi:L-cysteine/cystine lyase